VHAKYGVTSQAAKAALEQLWNDRFARDPALRTRWTELCAHYAAQLTLGNPVGVPPWVKAGKEEER